jgi:hypothetical protein
MAVAPVDQLLRPIVLLELLDDLNRRLAITPVAETRLVLGPTRDNAILRGRARLHTERAWVLMCLRDRHPEGPGLWMVWNRLMNLDVKLAAHLADQLEGR